MCWSVEILNVEEYDRMKVSMNLGIPQCGKMRNQLSQETTSDSGNGSAKNSLASIVTTSDVNVIEV